MYYETKYQLTNEELDANHDAKLIRAEWSVEKELEPENGQILAGDFLLSCGILI